MDQVSAHKNHRLKRHFKNQGLPRLISDLMNPLLMPPFVVGITIWVLGGTSATIGWITGIAVLFYTLIPFIATVYFVQTDKITSMDLPERKSRNGLFKLSITSAAAVSVCFFLTVSPIYQLVSIISLVFLFNALIGFGINNLWKMSIHTAALSSAGAILLYFSQLSFSQPLSGVYILSLTVLLLLLPLMIWARYRLNIHTLAELLGGAVSGFLLTIFQLSILIKIW